MQCCNNGILGKNRINTIAIDQKKISIYISFLLFMLPAFVLFFNSGCAKKPPSSPVGYPKPYKINGKWYQPIPHATGFSQRGTASWYGKQFHGKKTASGEIYNMYSMTAAHKTLPLGTYVRVQNLSNKRRLVVRINDRGPFVRGRIIDLSYTAAKKLGIVGPGTAPAKITALGTVAQTGSGSPERSDRTNRSYIPVDYYRGNFTFQIGAFRNRENAENQKLELAKKYRNAHIKIYNSGGGIYYRVRVGRFSNLKQAQEYEKILVRAGYKNAIIVAE